MSRSMARAEKELSNPGCCSKAGLRKWCEENSFLLATVCAVIVGISLGLVLRHAELSYDGITWISIWGELFMRMLKFMIIPLSTTCIIVGIATMEAGTGGKLVVVSLGYIYLTQAIAVLIGIGLAKTIHPGTDFGDYSTVNASTAHHELSYTDVFGDFARNLVPENLIQACLENAQTDIVHETVDQSTDDSVLYVNGDSNSSTRSQKNTTKETITKHRLSYKAGPNLMGLVVISVAIAVAMRLAGQDGQPFLLLFESMNKVFLKLMDGVIWCAPVGIVSLIAGGMLKVDDLGLAFRSLGMLAVTTLVGQIIHAWILLPSLFFLITRKNPFRYLVVYLKMILSASAATSSAVAFPFLIRDSEKAGLDPRVTKFFAPMAITMNRDGSAMFICMAAIFVAQTYGITLGVGPCFVIGVLVTFLSGAVAMVPSSSIVILLVVANAIDIPIADRLGLLLTIDWLLDRLRTSTNIISHGYGCVFTDHFCGGKVKPELHGLTSITAELSSGSDEQVGMRLLDATLVRSTSDSSDSGRNGLASPVPI